LALTRILLVLAQILLVLTRILLVLAQIRWCYADVGVGDVMVASTFVPAVLGLVDTWRTWRT
jgi:hypothetical protein